MTITKQWNATADFTNLSAQMSGAGDFLHFRHHGCRNGEAWNSTDHPDTNGEALSGWQQFADQGTSSSTFSSSLLRLTTKREDSVNKKWAYWRATKTLLAKTDTFDFSCKFRSALDGASGKYACCMGFFGSTENSARFNNVFFYVSDTGAESGLVVSDTTAGVDSDTDATALTANTWYWLKIQGNGTNITAKIFDSEAKYLAGTNETLSLSVAVSDVSGTLALNRLGVHNGDVDVTAVTQVVDFAWFDSTNSKWTLRHYGRKDGAGFNSIDFPTATGQTGTGWTETIAGSGTSSAACSNGLLVLTMKREASTAKKFFYARPTAANVLKNSVFDVGCKFQSPFDGSNSTGASFGLIGASSDSYNVNCITADIYGDGSSTRLLCYDSVGTLDSATSATALSANTDYWVRLKGDGTNITLKIYASEANYNNEASPVISLSVAVADISGTITCTNLGWRNHNVSSGSVTCTQKIYWVEGTVCSWYDTLTARLADVGDWEYLQQVLWSTFAADVTGNVKFDLRKQETLGGSYTTYTNSGNHYTAAQIAALENENIYGLGLDAIFDATDTTCQLDNGELEYDDDENAPADLDYLSAMNPVTGMDQYAVRFLDPTDTGGSGLKYLQMRISEDGGSTFKYIGWNSTTKTFTLETNVANATTFRNPGHGRADIIVTGYLFGIDVSDLGITAETILIWMRGIDVAGNSGGWTLADTYAPASGGDLAAGSIITIKGLGRAVYVGNGLAVER